MTKNFNEDFNVTSLDSNELPFDKENDTIVVEMSSCQYSSVHSVLNVVDRLYKENEMLKHRISNLLTIISIYGLVFSDEVCLKLEECGFKILVLNENEGLHDFADLDDDALFD